MQLPPLELHGLMTGLLAFLSVPQVGLGAVFLVALVSATLLPMGSEPAVLALVTARPDLFWPAVGVATLGNTLGGVITWWMGWGAAKAYPASGRAQAWLVRWGPAACLLSWLPVVGDPLCAVAGWLRLPFWPCVFYMAVGKALRYITLTALLMGPVQAWLHP